MPLLLPFLHFSAILSVRAHTSSDFLCDFLCPCQLLWSKILKYIFCRSVATSTFNQSSFFTERRGRIHTPQTEESLFFSFSFFIDNAEEGLALEFRQSLTQFTWNHRNLATTTNWKGKGYWLLRYPFEAGRVSRAKTLPFFFICIAISHTLLLIYHQSAVSWWVSLNESVKKWKTRRSLIFRGLCLLFW